LDRRYRNIPEWEPLRSPTQLGWAALACAADANLGAPDFSVDEHGWRPPVKLMRGPPRLGLLGDRDGQPQHAGVVVRLDAVEVEVVTEDELPAEQALRPLGGERLPVAVARRALRLDGQDVALHVDVERVRGDPGQVELDDEAVPLAPCVHRHDRRARRGAGAQELLGEPVEVAEGVGTHQHGSPPMNVWLLTRSGSSTLDVAPGTAPFKRSLHTTYAGLATPSPDLQKKLAWTGMERGRTIVDR